MLLDFSERRTALNTDQSKILNIYIYMSMRYYFRNCRAALSLYLLIATNTLEAMMLYGEQIYNLHMDKICLSIISRLTSLSSFSLFSYQRCPGALVIFVALHWACTSVSIYPVLGSSEGCTHCWTHCCTITNWKADRKGNIAEAPVTFQNYHIWPLELMRQTCGFQQQQKFHRSDC